MSFDLSGVLAKMCVDHAELPEFPVSDGGCWSADEVALVIGKPVEVVATMDETEVRACWKAAHAVKWAQAFGQQVQKAIDEEQRKGRRIA